MILQIKDAPPLPQSFLSEKSQLLQKKVVYLIWETNLGMKEEETWVDIWETRPKVGMETGKAKYIRLLMSIIQMKCNNYLAALTKWITTQSYLLCQQLPSQAIPQQLSLTQLHYTRLTKTNCLLNGRRSIANFIPKMLTMKVLSMLMNLKRRCARPIHSCLDKTSLPSRLSMGWIDLILHTNTHKLTMTIYLKRLLEVSKSTIKDSTSCERHTQG